MQFRGGGGPHGNPLQDRMTSSPSAKIAGIYRYPVKGLTPEPLDRAALSPGQTLLADRRYAIENGPSGFDPAEPKWLSKPHFLMLQRDEWLAPLQTHFDDASHVLTIRQNGAVAAAGRPRNRRGPDRDRAVLCQPLCRPDQGTAKDPDQPGPQLFGRRPQGGLDHQSRQRPRHREHGRPPRPSASLPRQPLCRGLAGLARVRPARPDARDRRYAGSRWSSASSAAPPSMSIPTPAQRDLVDPAHAAAPARPRRLRDLCRGDRRRQHRRRRCDDGNRAIALGSIPISSSGIPEVVR